MEVDELQHFVAVLGLGVVLEDGEAVSTGTVETLVGEAHGGLGAEEALHGAGSNGGAASGLETTCWSCGSNGDQDGEEDGGCELHFGGWFELEA